MTLKICKECRHHGTKKHVDELYCSRPWRPVDIVTGEPNWALCRTERIASKDVNDCGLLARYYEPLPTLWQLIREKFSGPREQETR
jgi:hypothetical protein